MELAVILLAVSLAPAFAAEESCVGRCAQFDPRMKCQCDSMCRYHGSCCMDFDAVCPRKARGDTFETPEEDVLNSTTPPPPPTTLAPPNNTILPHTPQAPTLAPDPDAAPCSGRPYDAFLQLKNGSIFAFRGEYFFEMDERAVVPGYPKLIRDVWGISGPIDAAFTRINCQGKTYIFKGSRYWRFEGDVLDEGYPRDIHVGFENIPDGINAAFAIPAPGHHGNEKAYFFKGSWYYQYEFKHQPSHAECVHLSRASPSLLFTRYTNLYCDTTWEDLFTLLFQGLQDHTSGPRLISTDWAGVKGPLDAAMVGRLYIAPSATPSPAPIRRRSNRRRKNKRRLGQRRSRSIFFENWSPYYDDWFGADSYGSSSQEQEGAGHDVSPVDYSHPRENTIPVQSVYFFKSDKYYRLNLQTKRVDFANPPYPRSIAKFWMGCQAPGLEEK